MSRGFSFVDLQNNYSQFDESYLSQPSNRSVQSSRTNNRSNLHNQSRDEQIQIIWYTEKFFNQKLAFPLIAAKLKKYMQQMNMIVEIDGKSSSYTIKSKKGYDEISSLQNKIEIKLQSFEEPKTYILQISGQKTTYLLNNYPQIVDEFEAQNQETIVLKDKIDQSEQGRIQVFSKLKFKNQTIKVIMGDINFIKCDAIVCQFNYDIQLEEVQQQQINENANRKLKKVYDEVSLKNMKQMFKSKTREKILSLQFGQAIYEKMKNKPFKYCICVANRNVKAGRLKSALKFSKGERIENQIKEFRENIQSIMKIAEELGIKSIAFPIFKGMPDNNQNIQSIFNEIIQYQYSSQNPIELIYFCNNDSYQMQNLRKQLTKFFDCNGYKPKYQFQWLDDQGCYQDYDDEDVNLKINKAYQQWEETQKKQILELSFSFLKQPGTHQVDLINKVMTHVHLNDTYRLSSIIIKNEKKYLVSGNYIDDELNDYFLLQELNKIYVFNIFYNKYKIIISEEGLIQKNLTSSLRYTRSIQKEDYYKKSLAQIIKCESKNYKLKSIDYAEVPYRNTEDYQISIQYFEQPGLQEKIQQMEMKLKQLVENLAKKKLQNQVLYPFEWEQQDDNLKKVPLKKNDQEYIKVSKLFQQTITLKIYEIFRIQNKILWENYWLEKQKLENLYQFYYKQDLAPEELTRYLWHGVTGKHPKVIYEGLKEGFDSTYSEDDCLWGKGIYFAENANYSIDYSYQLTASDDKANAQRKVFLCCQVTTGRVEERDQSTDIRRPSQGYDCVSGITNNCKVFILYGMDVRRVYPAYEIIYS